MKRVRWSIPSLSRAKRRRLRNSPQRSEVLEVRTLMSAAPLNEEDPADPENTDQPVDDLVDGPDEQVIFYNMLQEGAPSAISNFSSREEFGDYLLDRALSRYEGMFGQPAWWYRGPIYYLDGGPVAMAAGSLERTDDHSETNVQGNGVDE